MERRCTVRERADFNRLRAELDGDMVIIRDNEAKNAKAKRRIEAGAQDELDWAALGYTIHNLYNAIESYFLRIAKFFENALSPDTWHRDLIAWMTAQALTNRGRATGRHRSRDGRAHP